MNDIKSISSSSPINEKINDDNNDDDNNDNEIKGGTLVISGCIDWDKPIGYKGKDIVGLDEPSIIKFDQPVMKSFSSSSSFHFFILLQVLLTSSSLSLSSLSSLSSSFHFVTGWYCLWTGKKYKWTIRM